MQSCRRRSIVPTVLEINLSPASIFTAPIHDFCIFLRLTWWTCIFLQHTYGAHWCRLPRSVVALWVPPLPLKPARSPLVTPKGWTAAFLTWTCSSTSWERRSRCVRVCVCVCVCVCMCVCVRACAPITTCTCTSTYLYKGTRNLEP
jgi:hypothetical protein